METGITGTEGIHEKVVPDIGKQDVTEIIAMPLIDAHVMRSDILSYINGALTKSVVITPGKASYDEAQIIANMVFHFTNDFHVLSGKYKNFSVDASIGSIFVHQRPYVKITKSPCNIGKSIEIGDLLLFKHRTQGSPVWKRSSLLLQAKRTNSLHDTPGNLDQHCLYVCWPEFEYVNRKDFPIPARKVTGPLLSKGSKYLYIQSQNRLFGGLPWCCGTCLHCSRNCSTATLEATPINSVNPNGLMNPRCFVSDLYDFMFGNAGRPFFYGHKGIGWSRVMTDLIDVTAKNIVNKMKIAGATNGARGQGVLSFCVGTPILTRLKPRQLTWCCGAYNADSPPEVPGFDEYDEEEKGISIIEFKFIETEN
ncbi:MAG: hypothetical protein HQM04_16530 [Magnetococcales bacterium]|nr:hypothetical protein [Magnetococcales bacterium]MBF0116636.1 hypothetical protein [Magnetococcales bacterium]